MSTLSSESTPEIASGAIPHAEVRVSIGETELRSYTITPGEYLIGRGASCHIPLEATNVSRMHARLSFTGHRLLLEDLQSANGTFIQGERIELPTPVQSGTEIHIGGARLLVRFDKETLDQIRSALADPELGLDFVREELSGESHKIGAILAEGGMGMVLKASDVRIHRTVAMKILRQGSEYAVDKLMRFVAEAQLTGQLEHPNIVPIYQLGVNPDGQTFYTMKYVRGQTLEEILEALRSEDPLAVKTHSLQVLLTIFQKACDAVAFAHSKGIVHRDLKPQNIMVGAYGEVLVMDWGLAKRYQTESHPEDEKKDAPPPLAEQETSRTNTQTSPPVPRRAFYTLDGAVVGTPPFISPEQAAGHVDVGPQSDVYVLGMILYTMVALRPPLFVRSVDETIEDLRANKLIPLKQITRMTDPDGAPAPRLVHCPQEIPPPGLIAVIEKAMAHDPQNRYASVAELQEDLGAFQNGFATKAEHASFFRQLQLLLSRRRREAALLGAFLLLSQILLGTFLVLLSAEKNQLNASRKSLEATNSELNDLNDRLKRVVSQLRSAADTNYADAVLLLNRNNPTGALEQINLALMGVPDGSEARSAFLIIRGHARTRLGFFTEALEDYASADNTLPGILPMSTIREDLSAAVETGERPPQGWAWEKKMPPVPSPVSKMLKLLQHNNLHPAPAGKEALK